ncbi:MAG: tetratricopeptide repeat protein [Flammeovirgaceae bacterium]
MEELDTHTYNKIQYLCRAGDEFADKEDYQSALRKYNEALELLPIPKTKWEAGTWIMAAIADIQFLSKNFEEARQILSLTLSSFPNALENPFFHLRYGQSLYELKNVKLAAHYLCGAFAMEGKKIFQDEHPKYLNFLKTKIETD